jgi:hypothetical protein
VTVMLAISAMMNIATIALVSQLIPVLEATC